MKVLGVIPARYASARLPGKPLLNIEGEPMVVRTYRRAKEAKGLSYLLVATDDKRIANVLESAKIPYSITKSSHLNGTSRCWEAYQQQSTSYDFVINIQGDEPFLQPSQIEVLLTFLQQKKKLQIATLIKRITDKTLLKSSHTIKVVCDTQGRALYFSRSVIPYARTSETASVYYKHLGFYAYSPKV